MSSTVKCPFCSEEALFDHAPNISHLYSYNCTQICGFYYIEYSAQNYLETQSDTRNLKLNAIRENILLKERNVTPYWSVSFKEKGLEGLKSDIFCPASSDGR